MKAFVRAILRAVERAGWFIANPFEQRQRNNRLKELEAERLDRLRNPAKYRGK